MSRPHRIEIPHAAYHVTSRGSDRRDIYADDADRWLFLRLLGIATVKHSWTVLAYCLMTNHYHLVVEIADGGLSLGMQWLNGGFSRITNAQRAREAHLFRNRFRSRLLESEAHLFSACRYAILNPVAAGICERPEDWPWSSYRATAGIDSGPGFLADRDLLRRFDLSVVEARARYREFVDDGIASARAAAGERGRHTSVSVSDTVVPV